MQSTFDLLKELYDKFNARDIDGILAHLHPDVVWANGIEGGFVHGRDGVRSYWSRQWLTLDPRVDPVGFEQATGNGTAVKVHQVVRDLKGEVLADNQVEHLFQIEDGLVTRFDIR